MTTITEADVEEAALAWLAGLGWSVEHGPAIPQTLRSDALKGCNLTHSYIAIGRSKRLQSELSFSFLFLPVLVIINRFIFRPCKRPIRVFCLSRLPYYPSF